LLGSVTLTPQDPSIIRSQVRKPAADALSISQLQPVGSVSAVISTANEALGLTGHLPVLGPMEGYLNVTGYAVTLHYTLETPAASVTLDPKQVAAEYRTKNPLAAQLSLTGGNAPTLEYSTFLLSNNPRFISLTVNRKIEHIATPDLQLTESPWIPGV
jgi:hypothetical protein